jgi:hypothetical protein
MEPKPPEAAAAANSSVSANPTNHAVTSDASGAHVTAEAPLLPVSADGSVAANWPVTVSGRVASIPADEHAPAQLTAALYACPKCGAGFKAGDEECQKCGVVFLKFAEKLNREKARGTGYKDEDSFSASKEVRYLWEDVLNDFEKLDTHQNFVSSAWADRSLDYAAHRYASILELAPQNEMAKRFLEEVRSLVHVKFEVTSDEAQKKSVFSTWLARVRLPITVQGVRWTNLVLMACGFMIVTGFFIPDMRNLVGFGSAVGFFVFALRYYFRAF